MDAPTSLFFNELLQYRTPAALFTGPQVATVTKVDTVAVTVMVTLDLYDPHTAFGPIPYSRSPAPAVGSKVLIVFVGDGIDQPWIVAYRP